MTVAALRLLVVGDALLDVDVTGRPSRLCPDAPVPVLEAPEEVARPGGAALAAALAAADGHDVTLVAAPGQDPDGDRLAGLLEDAGVRLVALPQPGATPVKRRIRADGQTLLRLDSGDPSPPGWADDALADLAGAEAVLVSDYGRGVAALPQLRTALGRIQRGVPVVWDPHTRGPAPLPGVQVVTPNAAEAALLSGAAGDQAGLTAISRQAAALVDRWQAQAVAVTLGGDGVLLSHGESAPRVVPAPRVAVTDPCGAGDRFSSAVTAALAAGALTSEAVQDAVRASATFLTAGGAAGFRPGRARTDHSAGPAPTPPTQSTAGTVVATGGCFDLLHAGHVATLEAARSLGDRLVVLVNSDASVRRLKGPGRPVVPEQDRCRVLRALAPVDDVVVFDEDTPVEALREVRPDVWVKGGDYGDAELPEAALLAEWGGQAVVVPYLEGRSTTGLVTTAADRSVVPTSDRP